LLDFAGNIDSKHHRKRFVNGKTYATLSLGPAGHTREAAGLPYSREGQ